MTARKISLNINISNYRSTNGGSVWKDLKALKVVISNFCKSVPMPLKNYDAISRSFASLSAIAVINADNSWYTHCITKGVLRSF